LNNSLMLVTALAPIIGYDRASALAKQAYETGKTLKEVVLVAGVMSEEEFDEIVDPDKMV
jgi:fumarate hydratase class II